MTPIWCISRTANRDFPTLTQERKVALFEAHHAIAVAAAARRSPQRFGGDDHTYWLGRAADWRQVAVERSAALYAAAREDAARLAWSFSLPQEPAEWERDLES